MTAQTKGLDECVNVVRFLSLSNKGPNNSSVISMLTQGLSRLNMGRINLTIGDVKIVKDDQGRVVSIQVADLRLDSVYLNGDSTRFAS